MNAYGRFDLLLHRLALETGMMRRVAFDVDCMFGDAKPTSDWPRAPVYVSGLARSGTTVLLQALHASGVFATMTYRNMPFVTAPRLWPKITSWQRRTGNDIERVHGDRVRIGFDSPEAFEEPFWMMLGKGAFICPDGLDAHDIGDDGLADYRRFVANTLAASKTPDARYLAKNNNNVLRIRSLLRAFPDAVILVPFRDPWDHAKSLLRQHRRFSAMHADEPAALSYMNWLGHFEFGANFKPFKLGPGARPRDADELDSLDYWLRYWRCVYLYILTAHENDVVFFDYDRFCRDPAGGLERLAEITDLESARLIAFAANIRTTAARRENDPADRAVSDLTDLHVALQEKARQERGRSLSWVR